MKKFAVQAEGEFGEWHGVHLFDVKAAAVKYAEDINAALKPGVPQFKVYRLVEAK